MGSDHILVLNCGSSSIKSALFDGGCRPLCRDPLWKAKVQGIGGAASYEESGSAPVPVAGNPATSFDAALQRILEGARQRLAGGRPALVVHRVVHGGGRYFEAVRIDAAVLADLTACIALAPLHQPQALQAIGALLQAEPDLLQVACFDTGFHRHLPAVEQALPLPAALTRHGLRRYGFHGLSYAWLAHVLAERHGAAAHGRLIAAHLGSGASLCAMHGLHSRATTMGFSALDGLMMGTRSGSIDPGVLLHLLQVEGHTPEQLARLLYHQSGLLGMSGIAAEPHVLARHEADPGEAGERARLALDLYVQRIVRETGALAAVLGGLDMLVFTAGVGEHCAFVRERVCKRLGWLGIELDEEANRRHLPVISGAGSRVMVAVEPANEEWIAASQARACLESSPAPGGAVRPG